MTKLLKTILIIIPPIILLLIFLKGKSFDNDFFSPQINSVQNGWMLPDNIDGWISANLKWFPEDKMFEKIDGKATFYRQIGVDGLLAGDWVKNGKTWGMYLFKMKNDNAAKQAFLSERGNDFTKINIGDAAYSVSGALTLKKQNLYLQLVADNPDGKTESVSGLALSIANLLLTEKNKKEDSKQENSFFALAKDFAIQGSDNFIAEDAFGYTSLKNVDDLVCVVNSSTAKWFFVENGAGILNNYKNELKDYGCENFFETENTVGGNMFGEWEMAGIINSNLFGVREAENKKQLLIHWEKIKNIL